MMLAFAGSMRRKLPRSVTFTMCANDAASSTPVGPAPTSMKVICRARSSVRYFDKGNLAVVGKNYAVLERGWLRTSGFLTWLVWAFVHILRARSVRRRRRGVGHAKRTSGCPAGARWPVPEGRGRLSLPQLQNRLRVQRQWLWSYFTGQRSSRLIPEPPRTPNG
jgi:hypothetical protein